jgi:peptidoglycan hydrolase CwlO-like protein
MRKKFQALQKDIEEQREQLSLQHEQQKELYATIKGADTLAQIAKQLLLQARLLARF